MNRAKVTFKKVSKTHLRTIYKNIINLRTVSGCRDVCNFSSPKNKKKQTKKTKTKEVVFFFFFFQMATEEKNKIKKARKKPSNTSISYLGNDQEKTNSLFKSFESDRKLDERRTHFLYPIFHGFEYHQHLSLYHNAIIMTF